MIMTITGPSGSGKTTVAFRMLHYWPNKIQILVASTSRPPRKREKDGDNYYFVDRTAFDSEDMVEQVEFGGNLYGFTKHELEKARDESKISIAVVNRQGAKWLKDHYGAITVFLKISKGTSRYRLIKRDGEEAGLERHKVDVAQQLYDHTGYDIIIRCAKRSVLQIIEQLIIGLTPYFEEGKRGFLRMEERVHYPKKKKNTAVITASPRKPWYGRFLKLLRKKIKSWYYRIMQK